MRIKKTCSEKWNLNIGRYNKPCRTELMDAVPLIHIAFDKLKFPAIFNKRF